MALRSDTRSVARSVEALAEYYRLSRSRKHAEVALEMAESLMDTQVGPDEAPFLDYAGGFSTAGLSPDSRTTAAATSGLVAAYELQLLLRGPTEEIADPIRNAALFLMNMQYRPQNSYLIRDAEKVVGAFRKSPQDLSIQLAHVAASVRALIGAATVTAETVAPDLRASLRDLSR